MESLRNSFDQLIVNMLRWMARSIDFVDHGSPASLAVFWGLFGLDEGWIQLLVHLQLRCHGGRLLVARRFAGDDTVLQMISTCLMRMFRFAHWTKSRLCSVGPSCRCLVGSIFVGLQGLVEFVLDDPQSIVVLSFWVVPSRQRHLENVLHHHMLFNGLGVCPGKPSEGRSSGP